MSITPAQVDALLHHAKQIAREADEDRPVLALMGLLRAAYTVAALELVHAGANLPDVLRAVRKDTDMAVGTLRRLAAEGHSKETLQ